MEEEVVEGVEAEVEEQVGETEQADTSVEEGEAEAVDEEDIIVIILMTLLTPTNHGNLD